jgi:curved DNA-binding protein CbpA
MRTHYEKLGVAPHASHDEVRRAYRRLAQLHHPDANPGAEPEARAQMAAINAAWAVLGDPDKRRAYDRAIGTTTRPQYWSPDGDGGEGDGDWSDPLAHLHEDDVPARKSRPSDVLIGIPVLLFVVVLAMFSFSLMSQSEGLRTASLMMAPVTLGSFVAAPLFMMLRSRGRDDR